MPKSIEQRNAELSSRIMRRVYFVWGLRMVLNPRFLKSLIALVLLYRTTEYVSYTHVLANRPRIADIPANLAFISEAFAKTEVASVLLIVGTMALMAWLASDFMSKTRQQSSFF
jgi:hypothetical protein